MARRKLKKATSKRQACAIGFAKARKAGLSKKGQGAACGKEMKIFKKGKKSPRRLVLASSFKR